MSTDDLEKSRQRQEKEIRKLKRREESRKFRSPRDYQNLNAAVLTIIFRGRALQKKLNLSRQSLDSALEEIDTKRAEQDACDLAYHAAAAADDIVEICGAYSMELDKEFMQARKQVAKYAAVRSRT